MMSYNKYERGRQHPNGGHQRITYKIKITTTNNNNRIKIKTILTLRLSQSIQWVGVDQAARIHLLNSPPMNGSVDKK